MRDRRTTAWLTYPPVQEDTAMLARIRKAQENEDGGFTLIELLVVMIIIGILAAIAIPAFLSQKKKGVEAGMKSDLRTLATEASTQLVDQPTTAPTVGGTNPVTVGTATVSLSSGNTLVGAAGASKIVSATDGTYCFQLTNTGAGSDWIIYKNAGADAQTLKAVTTTSKCTAGVGS